MRNYTFLSKNGHIPETVFTLKAAQETAKQWAKTLDWEVLICSYEATNASFLNVLQNGKARTEGVVDNADNTFYPAKDGKIYKNNGTWAYILNRNLSPAPYLTK